MSLSRLLAMLVVLTAPVVACAAPVEGEGESEGEGEGEGELAFDDEHKLRAMQIISVFENSTIELQYDYVEALDDGRGYTCGLGFTTGTGDALEVVELYEEVTESALSPFLPRLRELAEEGSGDIDGLEGFPEAWQDAALDVEFRAIQEDVTDVNSYEPALGAAADEGLSTALGLLILYDTAWMHGPGDDPDGLFALIARTDEQGDVDTMGEHAWLDAFLAVRRADMLDPADSETQAEWSEAVTRVDALHDILDDGNDDLDGPITIGHGFDTVVP